MFGAFGLRVFFFGFVVLHMKRSRESDNASSSKAAGIDFLNVSYVEERLLFRLCDPGNGPANKGSPISLDDFAVMVAANDEVSVLEEKVRGMAAKMAATLPDDDEVFRVEFSDGSTKDSIRYCKEMIPILMQKFSKDKKTL